MTKQKKQTIIWTVGILAVVAIFVLFLVKEANKPGKYDSFAQCVADSGTKFMVRGGVHTVRHKKRSSENLQNSSPM